MRLGDKIGIIWFVILLAITPILMISIASQSDYSFMEYIDDYGVSGVIGESIGVAIIPTLLPWGLYRLLRKSKKKQKGSEEK